jgi:hypothetical protein
MQLFLCVDGRLPKMLHPGEDLAEVKLRRHIENMGLYQEELKTSWWTSFYWGYW